MRLTGAARGFTLIELLITLAIGGILLTFATPMLTDYLVNSRLREGGNAVHAEALWAQSEAIKRNGPVQLTVDGSLVRIRDRTVEGLAADPAGAVLRERQLPDGISSTATATVLFSGEGRTSPFGTEYAVDLEKPGITCSTDYRCPGLRVDAGGAMRLITR